jgi:hypothetical protein
VRSCPHTAADEEHARTRAALPPELRAQLDGVRAMVTYMPRVGPHRQCSECPCTFRRTEGDRRSDTCSNECARARANRLRRRKGYREYKIARMRCARCGDPFEPKRLDARYCSNACRQAAYRAAKAAGSTG